ncbi:MAG: hndC 2, partial [Sporomusa sp.]|nr:hndC 2 [Sporomusa sp.]
MEHIRAHVLICAGTGCVSSGSKKVEAAFQAELVKKGLDKEVKIIETGCHGFCEMGPLVIIYPEGTFYVRVQESDVAELVENHLFKGRIVERLLYKEPITHEKIPSYNDIVFYKKQMRYVLANCGHIDPEDINEYIAEGGYEGLGKVLTEMQPADVVAEVKKSGLRGRGGGGFPTGMKWEFTRNAPGTKKYVVCNADEGDPGAFMDRSVLEGDPHRVIEGMAVCGYAIGADEGYLYVRAEYPLAIKRLKIAIKQAEELGLLGENILGSGFNFKLKIKEGAGAFVCGEETALLASIEGKRGMPRPRPPFPAISGLWGKPTNINNVET